MEIDKKKLIRQMLISIGEDPNREGLVDTPARVEKMWDEIFRGYKKECCPKVTTFLNGHDGIVIDEMIIDKGPFTSHCEHHMVPFIGTYCFAFIPHPNGKILGLSKVGRIVDYYSARLQVQERLVHQIIEHLWDALILYDGDNLIEPLGMGLTLKAEHLCKTMRGVKKKGMMVTTKLKGAIKTNPDSKSEFMQWAKSD
jgi:GTP cyclohydrolase IA